MEEAEKFLVVNNWNLSKTIDDIRLNK